MHFPTQPEIPPAELDRCERELAVSEVIAGLGDVAPHMRDALEALSLVVAVGAWEDEGRRWVDVADAVRAALRDAGPGGED